jgi:hypothetical protein
MILCKILLRILLKIIKDQTRSYKKFSKIRMGFLVLDLSREILTKIFPDNFFTRVIKGILTRILVLQILTKTHKNKFLGLWINFISQINLRRA